MARRNVELCLASPVIYPPRGGAEIRFFNYLSGLGRRDINVRLLSGTPKAKKLTEHDRMQDWYRVPPGSILPDLFEGEVPIHRIRLPDKSGWRRVTMFNRALYRHCREAERTPDIIQLIEPLSPLATPWLSRLKTLDIVRAFAYTLPYKLPAGGLKRALRKNALKRLYRQLDCVITSSTATRAHALGLGLNPRTEVIPNGVDLNRFQPLSEQAKKALRLSLGLGDIDKMMITVGTIIPRKGVDLLLESWQALARRFPELHFVLVGPRADENDPKLSLFNRKLVELVNASGAGNRVHFTGRVQNVEAYLQAADLFVFASEREGMGNVVLEAMASGLPVVMTPFLGLPPDFGQPEHQFLLADRNPASIVEVVCELLENHERCRKLAANGRKWVEETMCLDRVLDRYAALYHELAGR